MTAPTDLIALAVRTLEQYRTASICKPRPGEEDTFAEAIEMVKRLSGAAVSHVGIWCVDDGSQRAAVAVGLEPDKDGQRVTWEQLQTLHDAGFDLLLRHTGHGPLLIVSEDIKRDWEKVRP